MNNPAPYLAALSHIDAPKWLATERHAALKRFLADGLPQTHQEGWKFTSLAHLEQAAWHSPAQAGDESACLDVSGYPGHVLSFNNGKLAHHDTHLPSQVAGNLAHFSDSRMVHDYLGRLASGNTLSGLNLALWQDGARILVPAGKQLAVPIFAVYAANEAGAMLHPRTLALLESGSEAVLVEYFLGHMPQPYWQNAVCEIVLEEGAQLTHVRLLEEGSAASHTGTTYVRLASNCEYHALQVDLSGGLTRHDMVVDLEGPAARVRIDALELADGKRHVDLHLQVNHLAARSTSRISWHGMADQRGHAIFDGHVLVRREAHETDAKQSCRGLLLSPQAAINVMPRLEIYADDVKCAHGASIGNLNDAALFYLRSRGIELSAARSLLLQGFAAEAMGPLDDAQLGDWLLSEVTAAFGRHATGG